MATLCFSSQHRMNIGILLLGQLFKSIKLIGTTTDNGKNNYGNIVISNESEIIKRRYAIFRLISLPNKVLGRSHCFMFCQKRTFIIKFILQYILYKVTR